MRSISYPFTLVFIIAVAVIQSSAGADDHDEPKTISDIDVKLSVSSERYDPLTPSAAVVKCIITNKTDHALDVPSAYDGQSTRLELRARRWPWTLSLMPVPPQGDPRAMGGGGGGGSEAMKKLFSHPQAPLAHLEAGQSQTVFELKLDEILNSHAEKKADKLSATAWRWNWAAHGPPPQSPLVSEPGKFIPTANFGAVVTVGDKPFASNRIDLQIAPSKQ